MSLKDYQRKRNFRRTPEPTEGSARQSAARQFVVQKHAASRLHYDFRLELNGTLRSWAIPKGPSLDPSVKSLAVEVEDHPLGYASFEGVIPQGEYGGGAVMVWDRGTWQPEGDAAKGLKSGKLTFELHGEKLNGAWSLVRMRGRAGDDRKNWLLIKRRDGEAQSSKSADILAEKPLSVLSRRDMEAIANDPDRVWKSNKKSKSKRPASGASKPRMDPQVVKKQRTVGKKQRTVGKKQRTVGKKQRTVGKTRIGKTELAGTVGARRAKQPSEFKPQLAKLAVDVPAGDEWLHEVKFDGYRILAFIARGAVRLVTRNGNDWTHRFSSVTRAFQAMRVTEAIVDGEVVSVDDDGISNFQQLQNLLKREDDGSLVYYAFDIPYLGGFDLTRTSLTDRKAVLARVVAENFKDSHGVVRYSDHISGQGATVLKQACSHAAEGIVSKRADSHYVQGRTAAWLKLKCLKRQEFVIGGYTKPSGSRYGFGALLLGYYEADKLIYCGRIGTGFTSDSLRQLASEMKRLKTAHAPFDNPPTGSQRRGVTWVRPKLVGEVEFTDWTDDGLLRHPSFQGLREDKPAKQIGREKPLRPSQPQRQLKRELVARSEQKIVAQKIPEKSKHNASGNSKRPRSSTRRDEMEVAGVRLTHPDRILYPDQGLTKHDLAAYYERIADWILPHIVDRPLTLVRCPEGQAGQCFYQKHLAGVTPKAVEGVMIKEKRKQEEYVVLHDLVGLVSLVQMSVLEIHPWPARVDQLERPDRLVFDLDPGEEVAWREVIDAAKEIRDRLAKLGLVSFLRTSGGKGLHVVSPLTRRNSWDELKEFAKAVADEMVRSAPDRYIATMSKAKRRGKVFVDYLRNQRGATAIASYSTRAREGAPVSTPLEWREITARTRGNQFNVRNLPRRLELRARDPWEGFFQQRQSITAAMQRAVSR